MRFVGSIKMLISLGLGPEGNGAFSARPMMTSHSRLPHSLALTIITEKSRSVTPLLIPLSSEADLGLYVAYTCNPRNHI